MLNNFAIRFLCWYPRTHTHTPSEFRCQKPIKFEQKEGQFPL